MKTLENLKITNEDFFNYVQDLSPAQLKALNFKLAEVEPMKVTTGINGDCYKSFLIGIERKGKTLLIKRPGEWAEVRKYTFKNKRYSLKGYRFGHVNFNSFTDHRVKEI